MLIPFFSIVIITYNRPEFAIKAIESVLSQSFKNFELLVVNDGSNLDYLIVEDYIRLHTSITYIYKTNEGRSKARNTGIEIAKGQYICFLDDDDIYLPNNLDLLYNEILRNNLPVGLFFTLHQLVTEKGEIIPFPLHDPSKHKYGNLMNYLNCNSSTVCIHHEILMSHKFPEHISYWEDWDLWLAILKEFPQYPVLYYGVQINLHEQQTIKLAKYAVINKYFGIKWLYQRHMDVIPKKAYLRMKSENYFDLIFIYCRDGNFKRAKLFLWHLLVLDITLLTKRIFWSSMIRSFNVKLF